MTGNCDIAFETLVDYAADTIEENERARLESHVAGGCTACQRNLSWLRRITRLMKTDNAPEPPGWVIERAHNLFKERRARPGAWFGRITAFLLFDSGFQLSPAGVRSGGPRVRQLLYGTEDYDVDFLLEEADCQRRVNLSCQILPRGDSQERNLDYEIALTKGKGPVLSGRASPLGEFTADGLLPGVYDLRISLDAGELVIEGIEI